jgi:Rrf2 family protein
MLSQTAEHALRAVLYLARQEWGRPVAADRVADALGAPRNYLSKTLNLLAKEGILESTAGRRGGFSLAVPPAALSVARVLEVFQTPSRQIVCLLGDRPCDALHPCEAHGRWNAILESSRVPLAASTIADLLGASLASAAPG